MTFTVWCLFGLLGPLDLLEVCGAVGDSEHEECMGCRDWMQLTGLYGYMVRLMLQVGLLTLRLVRCISLFFS
jgi:hypothetical protein